jgi:tRNA (guanine37-N1)-methyltransferase
MWIGKPITESFLTMRFDVITLFPEMLTAFMASGVTRRAFDGGQLQVHLWNPREYATGHYRRVDDRPFGGGPGMVMLAEPLWQCLNAIRSQRQQDRKQAPLVYFSPSGETLSHERVVHWSQSSSGAVLLCGRYEGIDQRFIDAHVDAQISLGDFVLSGGEIPAMAFLDAIARLMPGVLHDPDSHVSDSFNPSMDGLLDCPHYTRPEVWQGNTVPEALLSGHHAQIHAWRRAQSLLQTQRFRPDLINAARAAQQLTPQDEAELVKLGPLQNNKLQ